MGNSFAHRLRLVALAEGVSFLLLLGVAMPLKYMAGLPQAVLVVGWFHGVLFTALCVMLLRMWVGKHWSFGQVVMVFVASLLPFGPFVIDRRLKQYEHLS